MMSFIPLTLLFLVSLCVCCVNGSVINRASFQLSLIHLNDFHARFEQISPTGTVCKVEKECIGGFPRLYTAVQQLKQQRPDSVLLNAGDSFQGSIWYTMLKWNVTSLFMNMLPQDAHALGNHEFDNKVAGLVPYLQSLKQPMVVSNMDVSQEPTLKGLFQDSLIIERNGRKIGIIGVILKTTNQLAQTEKVIFTDEIVAVKRVSSYLKSQGVNIIIVLSHCGLEVDRDIAANGGNDIDIIVGGHSHTLLYPIGENPPSGEKAKDDYPVVVKQPSGNTVLIVQASAFTKYLGYILVDFDVSGHVVGWKEKPIYLDQNIKQDEGILKLLQPYKVQLDQLGKRKLGYTNVKLDRYPCYSGECNIGDFIANAFVDSMVEHAEPGYWTYAAVCIINQGGIRTNIEIGDVLFEDLLDTQPFGNYLVTYDIKGKYILEALEYGVAESFSKDTFMSQSMLQVSGLHVVFNVTNPPGSRLLNATIRCAKCDDQSYSTIEMETVYRVVSQDFIANGGDGFTMLSKNKMNTRVWDVDIDILEKYVAKESPITVGLDGRITVHK